MKKHTYRSKNVNKINFAQIKERLAKEPVVFAIDIAKEKQYGLLSNASSAVSELIWWKHPDQTVELLSALKGLESQVDIVIESTGTYHGETVLNDSVQI